MKQQTVKVPCDWLYDLTAGWMLWIPKAMGLHPFTSYLPHISLLSAPSQGTQSFRPHRVSSCYSSSLVFVMGRKDPVMDPKGFLFFVIRYWRRDAGVGEMKRGPIGVLWVSFRVTIGQSRYFVTKCRSGRQTLRVILLLQVLALRLCLYYNNLSQVSTLVKQSFTWWLCYWRRSVGICILINKGLFFLDFTVVMNLLCRLKLVYSVTLTA